MARPRISILGMSGLIAFVALSLGCLLHASAPWAVTARAAYFVALGTAPLGVVYLRRDRQAFYLGFALWAWFYQFLWLAQEPITSGLLDFGYEIMIPGERQANEEGVHLVDLPMVNLDGGQSVDELGRLVDLREKGGLVVEGAKVGQKGRAGPMAAHLVLRVDAVTASRLEDAKTTGAQLTVSRHRPRPFSRLTASPPVDRVSFDNVGHAILGILAGFAGGIIGWRFYAMREAGA